MNRYYTDCFKISGRLGWIVYSDKGLFALQLPQKDMVQPSGTVLKRNKLAKELEAYFKGKKTSFDVKIDWTGFSNFEKRVLKKCQLIKYGRTVSYKQLAKMANKDGAWRAVGNVLAKNRLLITIPCHRVIKSDGKIGGFSNSLETKKKLLELEKNGSI